MDALGLRLATPRIPPPPNVPPPFGPVVELPNELEPKEELPPDEDEPVVWTLLVSLESVPLVELVLVELPVPVPAGVPVLGALALGVAGVDEEFAEEGDPNVEPDCPNEDCPKLDD